MLTLLHLIVVAQVMFRPLEQRVSQSALIVTGIVEDERWVVDTDKLRKGRLEAERRQLEANAQVVGNERALSIYPLLQPSSYTVGRVYRVRVDEWLKPITGAGAVMVYVDLPVGVMAVMDAPVQAMKTGERLLLFLSPTDLSRLTPEGQALLQTDRPGRLWPASRGRPRTDRARSDLFRHRRMEAVVRQPRCGCGAHVRSRPSVGRTGPGECSGKGSGGFGAGEGFAEGNSSRASRHFS